MYPIAYAMLLLIAAPVAILLTGVRIVRPTHKGLVERLGKYRRFRQPGFNWIIPGVDRMIQFNTTEQMVDAQPQELNWMLQKDSHSDQLGPIAAATYDLANFLVGRRHAQDTQLLWATMDAIENVADVRGCP